MDNQDENKIKYNNTLYGLGIRVMTGMGMGQIVWGGGGGGGQSSIIDNDINGLNNWYKSTILYPN